MWLQGLCILPKDVPQADDAVSDVFQQMLSPLCDGEKPWQWCTADGPVDNGHEQFLYFLEQSSRRIKHFDAYTMIRASTSLNQLPRTAGLPSWCVRCEPAVAGCLGLAAVLTPDGEWHVREHEPLGGVDLAWLKARIDAVDVDWSERLARMLTHYEGHLACAFWFHP